MEKTRAFSISREVVWESYLRVKANQGSYGVDEISIEDFEKDLKNNLYKLWARMSSGSYMPPPVKLVEIPKKTGGKRPLGIPTVSDRIAQGAVKLEIEKLVEPVFVTDSYGYRKGKSALEAVGKCRERCWSYDYVLEIDIKGFFDNISHELLMKAVMKHTQTKWHLLYIRRWLTADVQYKDGSRVKRTKGTPQGAVISPVLANLFLHYCMDKWMIQNFPQCPFERYADDAVIHCKSEAEAKELKVRLEKRMEECELELHPDKTRIVYCQDCNRSKEYEHVSFDFLGYGFQPRPAKNYKNEYFIGFTPAVSKKSCKSIMDKVRNCKSLKMSQGSLKDIAIELNPKLQGWINYYGKYCKSKLNQLLYLVDLRIARWARRKYKRFKGSITAAIFWVTNLRKRVPNLFAHWRNSLS